MFLTVVVAAVALIVVLGVAELVARWIIRHGRYYAHRPMKRKFFRPAPDIYPELEEAVHVDINRDGERGGPPPSEGKYYRILVAGGSAAECYCVDQQTSWPGALERELSKPEALKMLGVDRVHVGNLGKSGVDAGSLRRTLEKVLPNYRRLDAVLVMVGASDILRWLEVGAPADRPVTEMDDAGCFVEAPDVKFGASPSRSALAELVRRLRTRIPSKPEFEPAQGRWLRRAREMRMAATEIRNEVPTARIVFDTFDEQLREVIRLARRAAPLVILVRQPWFEKDEFTPEEEAMFWNGGVGQAYREQVTTFYSTEVIHALMRELDGRAIEVAEAMGVRHVDLRPVIEMSSRSFYDHFHLTPFGCAPVAKTLAMVVAEEVTGHGAPSTQNA